MKTSPEDGFTLIELLIVTVIVGIIISAMGTAIVVALRTTTDTSARMAESHDAQMTAAFFVSDVQSADDVSTTDSTCAGTTPVVRLRWTDGSTVKMASYVLETAAGERRLVRKYCEDGVLLGSVAVSHNVNPAVAPALTCTPSCVSKPTTVSIRVTDASGYAYDVSGARRTP